MERNQTNTEQEKRVQLDILQVEAIPGFDSQEEDLSLTWNLTRFSSSLIEIQLEFRDPLKVSSNQQRDKL